MSYTNTTTHFQWPLPEETDLFNGLDDNQMKEDLDEKIYNLEQQSTGDHEAVTQLNERVTEVEQTVGGYDAQIEQLEGTVGEHAERLINLTNRQTELSRRLNDKAGESTIAAEYNEEESYSVGDFVYYANILYKCKNASATPAGAFNSEDWDIAILTDELGGSTPTPGTVAAANVSFDDTSAQLGASNVQNAIEALDDKIEAIPTLSGERVVGRLNGANVYEKIYTSATEIAPATTIIDANVNTSTVKYLLSVEGSAQAPGVSNVYITINTLGTHQVYTQMSSSGLELHSDVSLKNISVTYRYIKA